MQTKKVRTRAMKRSSGRVSIRAAPRPRASGRESPCVTSRPATTAWRRIRSSDDVPSRTTSNISTSAIPATWLPRATLPKCTTIPSGPFGPPDAAAISSR